MVPVMNSHCCRCHPLMMDCEGPRARGAAACRAAPRRAPGLREAGQAGSRPAAGHRLAPSAGRNRLLARAAKSPLSLPHDPCPPRSPRGILGRERTSRGGSIQNPTGHPCGPERPPGLRGQLSTAIDQTALGWGARQQGVETPPGRGGGGQQAAPPPVPSPAPGIRGLSRHCGASRALCDHVASLRETTAKDKICSVLSLVFPT